MDDLDRIKSLAGLNEAGPGDPTDPFGSRNKVGPEVPPIAPKFNAGGGRSSGPTPDWIKNFPMPEVERAYTRAKPNDTISIPRSAVSYGASLLGHLGLLGAAALAGKSTPGAPPVETPPPEATKPETLKPTAPPTVGPGRGFYNEPPGERAASATTPDSDENQTVPQSTPDVDINRIKRSQQMFGIPGVQEENTSLSLLKKLAGL